MTMAIIIGIVPIWNAALKVGVEPPPMIMNTEIRTTQPEMNTNQRCFSAHARVDR